MNEQKQGHDAEKRIKATSRPKYIVGLDAHSRKQAISVWECTDPWNPDLYMENPKCDISKLKDYYEKNDPLDSITLIEASTNSSLIKGMLNDIGFRAEVVRSDVIADKQRKRKVCDINDARKLANAILISPNILSNRSHPHFSETFSHSHQDARKDNRQSEIGLF